MAYVVDLQAAKCIKAWSLIIFRHLEQKLVVKGGKMPFFFQNRNREFYSAVFQAVAIYGHISLYRYTRMHSFLYIILKNQKAFSFICHPSLSLSSTAASYFFKEPCKSFHCNTSLATSKQEPTLLPQQLTLSSQLLVPNTMLSSKIHL